MRLGSCDFFFFGGGAFIFHAKCSLTESLLNSLGLTEQLVKTSRNGRVTLDLTTSREQTACLLGVGTGTTLKMLLRRVESLYI